MPEETSSPRSLGTILITGLVSLSVGVSGGVFVNRVTERRPGLEYEFVPPAVFAGEKESIAVLTLKISNPAQKEVESVVSTVRLDALELREARVVGLQHGAYSQTAKDGTFQLDVPYLNPEETFSLQLLVASQRPDFVVPKPSVRAKGIVGLERTTGPRRSPPLSVLPLLAAAFSALLPVALLRLRRRPPAIFYTKKHRDDHRDVIAFLYGVHGFIDEANWARSSERSLSYWEEADRLTEVVLGQGDHGTIARAITCLEDLLEYAAMEEASQWLIHLDIARLAISMGDEVSAKKHLRLANYGRHRVIQKRVMLDDRLAALAAKGDV